MTKNYGPGTSGYLDPDARAWETTVYQAGKPILDKELNLIQDANQNAALVLQRRSFPSGWVSDDFLNTVASGLFNAEVLVANTVQVPALWAHVNGWFIPVTDTNDNTGLNNIDLGAGPVGVGARRTDLVILEVWRRLLPAAPTTTGKSPAGRIWRNGNVKIAAADDLALNFPDDILDIAVGAETTQRVQIQYRLRVITGVDIVTYNFGLANSTIANPVAVAHSVPASAAAPDGVATLFTYANQSTNGDPGLWVAGDGNTANTLGTVDGYMYALPLMAVFRRNTTAFARNTNHNGGLAYPGPSDRPDLYFSDIIEERDLLDLRTGVAPTGWDFNEILQKNTNFLFDNDNATEISSTFPLGGGSDGHTVLWADEIGVLPGDGINTGDTPGAEFLAQFDYIRRVFSDRATYETIVLRFDPPGGTWNFPDVLTISPTALPIYLPDGTYPPFDWNAVAPPGSFIVDITQIVFAGDTAGQVTFDASNNFLIEGLGSIPTSNITLTLNTTSQATPPFTNDATTEPLLVTLLVAYSTGLGLTKTPKAIYADNPNASTVQGVLINNPGSLPAAAPTYFSSLESPTFAEPNREVRLEYNTISHDYHAFSGVPGDPSTLIYHLPERPVGIPVVTVDGVPRGVASVDGYTVTLVGPDLAVLSQDVKFTYQAIRAIPQTGVQFTIYYDTRWSQTVSLGLLPSTLDLTSKYVAQQMYVLTAGSGAGGAAYPFPFAYVQSGGVYPGSGGTFNGDHDLDGDLRVSMTTLYTDTGFMQIPVHVPVVPSPNAVTFGTVGSDIEGRNFYKTTSGYGFLAIGPTLSDPKKHKNILPMLCELPADGPFGFKGQLVLVLLSRWADFDDSNSIGFVSDLAQNFTAASIYRLKGNLLSNRRL